MSLVAVVVLAVAGLAMAAVGIVALRDEPPRWMLRIRHPGRVLSLGLVLVVSAFVLNAVRYDIDEEIEDRHFGSPVECREVGTLEVEGSDRDVYACVATQRGGSPAGCYARVGDDIVDVSLRAEEPGAFPDGAPDC